MKKRREEITDATPYTGKTYAYISIGLAVAGAIALGLIFTPLGIYSLIAAVLFGIGSLSFAATQKRKNNFDKLIYIKIFGYVVLGLAIALFVGGIIWSEVANPA